MNEIAKPPIEEIPFVEKIAATTTPKRIQHQPKQQMGEYSKQHLEQMAQGHGSDMLPGSLYR